MIQEILDEVLEGEPRYTIKENDGSVFQDNMDIVLRTPIVQEGTPINKKLFNNIQGDLYTQDRYNAPNVVRKTRIVNYPADVILSEEKFEQDCIPKTWTEVTAGIQYKSSNGTTLTADTYRGSSFILSYACDGNEGTYYGTESNSDLNVALKFPRAIKITKMKIKILCGGDSTQYVVRGSNDNVNYDVLYMGTENNDELVEIELSNPGYYKWYKITNSDARGYSFIYEWQVSEYYEAELGEYFYVNEISIPLTSYEKGKIVNIEGGRIPSSNIIHNTDIIPKTWTQTTEGTEYVASDGTILTAKNYTSASATSNNACDGDLTSTFWQAGTNESWLKIAFTEPKKITKMKTNFRDNSSTTNASGVTAIIKGSNDNSDWSDLATYTGSAEYKSSELYEIVIDQPKLYKYYMLYLTGTAKPRVYEWQVSEWEEERDYTTSFYNPYLNINNLGEKQINGTINYGEKYSLAYNGESWDINSSKVVAGSVSIAQNVTVNIPLYGAKYVIADMLDSSIGLGARLVLPNDTADYLSVGSNSNLSAKLTKDGQTFSFISKNGNYTAKYVAIY